MNCICSFVYELQKMSVYLPKYRNILIAVVVTQQQTIDGVGQNCEHHIERI